ncbi:Peptidogalycan biosysnthesis/recognition [Dillenia turbinata]|uniref:Peptidogalycan biosysnthesis/recognition n=1 Tax=Dillenia turbinata TaxID=194707 RepID=A0AAN8UI07_9MAGN
MHPDHAIEAAIELNLSKVEAGAQGEHKIQRCYLPVTTCCCHYIVDEGFRQAIRDFLVRQTTQVKLVMKLLHDSGPFNDGIHEHEGTKNNIHLILNGNVFQHIGIGSLEVNVAAL